MTVDDCAGHQSKAGSVPLLLPTCHVRVATRRLLPQDEHILLGSETFWGLVSPGDAALRSHLHLKVRIATMELSAALSL